MDTTKDIAYRGFLLNDEDIGTNVIPGPGVGTGVAGCVVDNGDFSDVDVVQYTEKRSQEDGNDAGDVFLGARRIRISGTLYGIDRADLFDRLWDLRSAVNPVLAQRDSPLDYGYQPLTFSVPTNNTGNYPTGHIDLQVNALPRAFATQFQRDQQGGEDEDALAIPWQATFICKDPSITAQVAQDYAISTQTEVNTGTSATASTDLVNKTAHGLVAGDRVQFTTLAGGTGLNTTTAYYVLSSGLTTNAFKVSTSPVGAAIDITVNYTTANYVKGVTTSGNVGHRGNYPAPANMLIQCGPYAGSIAVVLGDSVFTITVPVSTNNRIIRVKGNEKVITLEELTVETSRLDLITFNGDSTWPEIAPGSSAYSIAAEGAVVASGSHFWFNEEYA